MTIDIAFFLPSLKGGGAERCMLTLAEGLVSHGFGVSIVTARAEGTHVREAKGVVRVVDLGATGVWKSIPSLARHLRRDRPKVLISALDHANLAALIAAQLSGSKVHVVVTTHTMVSLAVRLYRPQVAWAMTRLIRQLYPRADRVVAVSKASAADLAVFAGISPKSIDVIYNPVDTPGIIALSRSNPGSPWFAPNSPPVVTAVGNLWRHKDHQTLIEAVNVARRDRPIRLAILGEGPQRVALQDLVIKRELTGEVVMPGYISNPYAWMSRSGVFALSSKWEGLPTVLVEAMACGVTPVATDCPGGTAEILEHGRYGVLTPVEDVDSMAEALLHSLEHPFPPSQLRNRAAEFSTERAVQSYLDLVHGLI